MRSAIQRRIFSTAVNQLSETQAYQTHTYHLLAAKGISNNDMKEISFPLQYYIVVNVKIKDNKRTDNAQRAKVQQYNVTFTQVIALTG